MGVYVGLDIGGTKLMAAAANDDGTILKRTRRPTTDHWQTDLDLLNAMIAEITQGEPILGMGAAAGGPLDWQSGVVSALHAPTWRNIPLKRLMEERWDCPFWVDVDTNIGVLGEYQAGGRQAERLLYITISTGMGGGFLIDGRIYRGANSAHPEIAHQAIPFRCAHPERLRCECGAEGCLEGLISGNAIRRIYQKPAEELNDAEWEEVGENLGQGLRNLAAILTPDEIRIGGGVAIGGGERLIGTARRVMEAHLKIVPTPQVGLSRLGYDTALSGALIIARQGLE
jgi:predicted NBD/HSP70 family sugar kinase